MGIVTFAAPVSGLRGKVGGNIFSANKSGPYLKAWGRGTNPRTSPQTNSRASLVKFSQSWAAISQANKDDWDTYAALPAQDKTNSLGETFSISGFAWFIGININRLTVGDSQLSTSPAVAVPGTPTIEELRFFDSDAAGNSRIKLTSGSSGLSDNLAIYISVFNSDGRSVASQVRTHMQTSIPNASRIIAFQDDLESHVGTTLLGQKMFCEVATQNTDGRQGPRDSASAEAETN